MSKITNETFHDLAFPVARVRYSGPTNRRGSRYVASIRRDSERTYRASLPYEDDYGKRNHLAVALECLAKALKDNIGEAIVADYVAIPGDLSSDAYVFTFVPRYFFDGEEN